MKQPGESRVLPKTATLPSHSQRARYHAGALVFERRLVRDLEPRRLPVRTLQGLLVLGRDLYRIAAGRKDDAARDAAARAAAWRLRQGYEPSLVQAVLDRAMEMLFPQGRGAPGRRFAFGASGR